MEYEIDAIEKVSLSFESPNKIAKEFKRISVKGVKEG